jgi:Carboxypeptidase regulatory-like domain
MTLRLHRTASILLLLALTVGARGLGAQTAQTLRGRVVDAATGEPVASASVRATEESGAASVGGRTDALGAFSIRISTPGTYRVTAERIGFSTFTSEPVVVAAGANVEVVLRLRSTTLALDSVGVRVRQVPPFRDPRARAFWDRVDRGRGEYMTPERIARLPGARTSDFLRQMPQVHTGGFQGESLQLGTASRRCTPTIYVDGRKRPMYPGERVDDIVDRTKLWSIEVYPRAADAPPELEAETPACGVIVFWTLDA